MYLSFILHEDFCGMDCYANLLFSDLVYWTGGNAEENLGLHFILCLGYKEWIGATPENAAIQNGRALQETPKKQLSVKVVVLMLLNLNHQAFL